MNGIWNENGPMTKIDLGIVNTISKLPPGTSADNSGSCSVISFGTEHPEFVAQVKEEQSDER